MNMNMNMNIKFTIDNIDGTTGTIRYYIIKHVKHGKINIGKNVIKISNVTIDTNNISTMIEKINWFYYYYQCDKILLSKCNIYVFGKFLTSFKELNDLEIIQSNSDCTAVNYSTTSCENGLLNLSIKFNYVQHKFMSFIENLMYFTDIHKLCIVKYDHSLTM